jgi:4-hydroxythreonine-4-phosphate dehydrogenase
VKPVVAISLGDPCGIGPEVTFAALKKPKVRRALTPLVFGDRSFAAQVPASVLVPVSALAAKDRVPGRPNLRSGRAQYDYVLAAVEAARVGRAQAICTAPVSKEQISRAGVPFMGHTEVLAEQFGVQVLMMMDGPRVRVALATNHLPLSAVPKALEVKTLCAQLKLLSRALTPGLGRKPRIAVLGLNPHAGEGGLLGEEEVKVISPAISLARRAGVNAHGPFPADGLFAKAARGDFGFDAVLAMFHDQGLVAAKALDFERTVNVTVGLPVPRTSPDHGTAYDIAGRGVADSQPMEEALLKAAWLAGV